MPRHTHMYQHLFQTTVHVPAKFQHKCLHMYTYGNVLELMLYCIQVEALKRELEVAMTTHESDVGRMREKMKELKGQHQREVKGQWTAHIRVYCTTCTTVHVHVHPVKCISSVYPQWRLPLLTP